ncbi:Ger(x)C family spore germination protein [Bacillus salipaludis]|uniref:Ger(X)C family spore germination protein n=1 Tax=Bacillus salipaludis TaxID=2547811 RepID=A0A4R5VUM3_9BACI|nr:Ger(x)C family spore germination protein [Bacillus salipaludis]MDQ6597698.1 Ger(x)C family spore germination protein [Bacillus salipaludis]TDK62904.1 Ger(x)C family spore germination protein [Bacillus salipaludis]
MKRKILGCLLLSVFMLTGCVDQINVEDVTLTLILGLDLDEDNHLVVYMTSPVFNKEAQMKEEKVAVKAYTVRDSRELFDTTVMALTSGSKTQLILIGKKLLKQKNWIRYIDPYYRDPKNTVTTRVVAVDGPVSDLIFFRPKDKPRLPLYLANLVDTAYRRNVTVKTTLQEFHEQMIEKGKTASITEMKKNSKIMLTGTALLDENGLYKLTIKPHENKLLRILQNKKRGDFPFTLSVPLEPNGQEKHWLSFGTQSIKVKTKVRYDGHYIFDTNIKMRVAITEMLFPFNVRKDAAKLEKSIQTKLKTDFEHLIKKAQTAKIDPFGYGLYARAYTYPEWKKVQNQWDEVFSKADVNVKVNVTISGMGTIK